MKKSLVWLCVLLWSVFLHGQQDSIYVLAKVHSDLKTIDVQQRITITASDTQDSLQLLNWISAYRKKGTALAKRKLENRKKDLHFAPKEDLGELVSLEVNVLDSIFTVADLDQENIFIQLPSRKTNHQPIHIDLSYTLKLPSARFTGYGKSKNEVDLKYFFLVPDSFKNFAPKEKKFQNFGETAHFGAYWRVDLEVPIGYYSQSNLKEIMPHSFEGKLNEDPEFLITKNKYPRIQARVGNQSVEVDFGYKVNAQQLEYLEFFVPLQLHFIQKKTGLLPKKIFISKAHRKHDDFFGNEDIKFWKLQLRLFSLKDKTDLDYFSILSKKVLEQSLISYKEKHHTIINGLKTYLEIKYLEKHYANKRLLGNLPDVSIFGLQPLKWFHASKMKLLERYNFGYRYMMTRNLDQPIDEDFSKLSNMNALTMSHFESGRVLNYIAESMGEKQFDQFLTKYMKEYQNKPLNTKAFINKVGSVSNNDLGFIKKIYSDTHRINFNLKKVKINNDTVQVKIKHNLPKNIPFPLEQIDEMGRKKTHWVRTKSEKGKDTYYLPNNNTKKLIVNDFMYLPERNYRDNYRYTEGLFSNFKKVKFRFFEDIEDPEYNEIYLYPEWSVNAYDGLLLGMNFSNESFLDKRFHYYFTPYYSTRAKRITGSGKLIYRLMPTHHFLRRISFGVGGSYFHYNYDNAYRKVSAFTSFLLAKEPRSAVNQQVNFSYVHLDKDLPPNIDVSKYYAKYNLFNINYFFLDNRLIHEKYFTLGFQAMEDFQKLSAQAFYRYEFARNKKLTLRWFGGFFLKNRTKTDVFSYGVARITNYAFNYGLLGQSATSGFLSQQFILADGGFKSRVGDFANQWVTSVNADTTIWKIFHLYGDAGFYKNKNATPQFVWDSGVKLRIIPDFLEFYFPVYSTLGFEPQYKDYAKRIRFTLILDLQSIKNVLRRGWY